MELTHTHTAHSHTQPVPDLSSNIKTPVSNARAEMEHSTRTQTHRLSNCVPHVDSITIVPHVESVPRMLVHTRAETSVTTMAVRGRLMAIVRKRRWSTHPLCRCHRLGTSSSAVVVGNACIHSSTMSKMIMPRRRRCRWRKDRMLREEEQ